MESTTAKPPFPEQTQPMPGSSAAMNPQPDYGESSYKGSGRLTDKKTIITGQTAGSDEPSLWLSPVKAQMC